ncbi:HAMP domain-containing protein [Sulfitobacter mediterraneus]|uniref:adenylate/guanylate cyclase domain-containing protein n=1 Tax=Sulfitobacter mediterraneus TaxID=83219 RepID=UPI001931FF5F|nr:adenylate/guanylate cyclase domain-containing protein [Sulfitobacter mediterraneus]MBM1310260.1 HAMP domain-containing protein [Sulfitobacter mediterraneus]MBM1314144.1 HAMP domain-containing protein [Sulfitobacter mediterraneus]MBM1322504.1 HAMP domain-containing protein [Sulfitobacter mediterraneus]MBM1326416.1 HAMP domain-containing protein [Sulfitobacter mediterraneus]MBM1397762.1 HAMP domain-containing protein [Sulfitobacter mediterraneus]
MRFPLRIKFFLFATLLAVLPLAIVGQNLTKLTRDELKSAANEDLTAVASQLRRAFDNEFQGRWLSPLQVIRNGIDSPDLDVQQKVSLLTLGIQELPQVVALQLAIDGSKLPILAPDQGFAQRLDAAGLDPVTTLSTSPELLADLRARGAYGKPLIDQLDATGDWIATIALPLETKIAGREVTFAAKINLASMAALVANHPFSARGEISVIDPQGQTVLTAEPVSLKDRSLVRSALPLITANARADTLQGYTRTDGTKMLGAYAFPNRFPWAVVTEQSEDQAYGVVNAITEQILIVGLLGFAIASVGALIFARRLTKPILEIGSVAEKVGGGDFSARVQDVNSRDEIGDLSNRINQMIGHLGERLELMKFVSHGTMNAIQGSHEAGMSRGGQRRRVSVIFTDIRGYTEFSERVPPEVVIEALNQYFDVQTDIVEEHQGDVDKFIGDALVAVFEGDEMETRAVQCAVKITSAMQDLLMKFPDYNLHVGIGIASGEVVVGAMGARERMDFTVLGSTVNLSARLCSKADPGQVLLDQATRDASGDLDGVAFETLAPIALKGYADPVPNFAAKAVTA